VSSYFIVHKDIKYKKAAAIIGVVINLSILVFFKYSPLIAKTFFSERDSIGQFLVTLPLPIGISFFTFQGISLVVDVYRGKKVSSNRLVPNSFWQHALQILFFKGFFPQLISGPIVKAHDFIPQIGSKKLSDIQWEIVIKQLILGYFLKMVVADNLKDYTFWISYPYFQNYSSITLLSMLFGFSCQIFADFAGYSLIAIGLAKLFGYQFLDNFNFPYIATSFKSFWKRWHISLSTFLMEYLYFPLGGNRNGKLRTYFNLMFVMVIGGLWHGAAWSYAVWGLFHGSLLAMERLLSGIIKIKKTLLIAIFRGTIVFLSVTFAWLLFKLPNFDHVIAYFDSIFSNYRAIDNAEIISSILIYSTPILFYHLIYVIKVTRYFKFIKSNEYLFYGIMLLLIILNSGTAGAFIYFQF
jgi:alginate O-acetyltransferase complex protein AlgI